MKDMSASSISIDKKVNMVKRGLLDIILEMDCPGFLDEQPMPMELVLEKSEQ